jgi:hypothetical protein
VPVEVLEAWCFPAGARRFLAPVKARLREALYALEDGPAAENLALRPLVKAVYSEFVGWLVSDAFHDPADPLWRPDWHDAILSNAAVVTHRKARKAPGRAAAARPAPTPPACSWSATTRRRRRRCSAAGSGSSSARTSLEAPGRRRCTCWSRPRPATPTAPRWEIRRRVRDWQRGGGDG